MRRSGSRSPSRTAAINSISTAASIGRYQAARFIQGSQELGLRGQAHSSISVQEGQPATKLFILQLIIVSCGSKFLSKCRAFARPLSSLPLTETAVPDNVAAKTRIVSWARFRAVRSAAYRVSFAGLRRRRNRGPGAVHASHAAGPSKGARAVSLIAQRAAGPLGWRARFLARDRRDGRGLSDSRVSLRAETPWRRCCHRGQQGAPRFS